MIVDFHCHIIERPWLPEGWWDWLAGYYNSRRNSALLPRVSADDVVRDICDPGGGRLLDSMQQAGIDRSVVLPLDWGLLLGEPAVPIEEQHRLIAAIARDSGGRLVPFAGIDPRRENAVRFLRHCLDRYGMQGIKLYPATGYDLHDPRYAGVFRVAAEYRVPVLLHTGCSFGPFLSRYCGPEILDHLCASYPEVTFIAAHLGNGRLEEICWLGHAKHNLFADCSLMQTRARQNFRDFAGNLRLACDLFGSQRILFGSDWPFSQGVMRNAEFVEAFHGLKALQDPKFAGYEIRQVLGANAEKLLSQYKGVDHGNPADPGRYLQLSEA